MTSLRRSAIAPLLLGLCVTSAEADPITLGFNFTATNFPFSSVPSPVDPVVGSFSVTFDNAAVCSHFTPFRPAMNCGLVRSSARTTELPSLPTVQFSSSNHRRLEYQAHRRIQTPL